MVEPQKGTGAGPTRKTRSTSGRTARALPWERRGKAQHRSVQDRFYAGPALPQGARQGSQYQMEEQLNCP